MDTPSGVPESLMSWIAIASLPAGTTFWQSSPGSHRVNDWNDWENTPEVSHPVWNGNGPWERLDPGRAEVNVSGRIPPQLPIVNGAQDHLLFNEKEHYLEQTLARATHRDSTDR